MSTWGKATRTAAGAGDVARARRHRTDDEPAAEQQDAPTGEHFVQGLPKLHVCAVPCCEQERHDDPGNLQDRKKRCHEAFNRVVAALHEGHRRSEGDGRNLVGIRATRRRTKKVTAGIRQPMARVATAGSASSRASAFASAAPPLSPMARSR